MRPIDEILEEIAQARSINDAEALLRYAEELDEHQTPLAEAHAHRSRGTVCYQRGEYAAAHESLSRSLALFEELGDRVGVARVLSSIGSVHTSRGDLPSALECLHRALALGKEAGDRAVESSVATNLGNIYCNTGELTSALEHYYLALAIYEELGDRNGMAGALCNIGLALFSIDDYPAALEHLYRSLELSTELENKRWAANALLNIGNIFDSTSDYSTALEHYDKAVAIYEEIGDKSGIASATTAIGWTHQNSGDLTMALTIHYRALALHQELGEAQASANDLCNVILVLLEQRLYDEARPHLETMDTIQIGDPALRIWREQCRAEIQAGSGDHDAAVATLQHALSEANDHGLRSKAADVRMALRDLAQKNNDLAGYIEHNNEYTRIINEINGKDTAARLATQEAQREIAKERQEHQKHLAILHSTLPKHIADRVARGETVNDHFDNAAVIFLDIVGFTTLSDQLSSTEVVQLLDTVFTTLDAVCKKHDVVKIKTIGDSYMAVAFPSSVPHFVRNDSSVPHSVRNDSSYSLISDEDVVIPSEARNVVERAANAALDMLHAISHIVSPAGSPIQVRLGVHCGAVTAGVLGTERMQYDVWGDTVNTASRMESSSEPGRIHVSSSFAIALSQRLQGLRLQDQRPQDGASSLFPVTCSLIPRGEIEVKGKGLMQTYWLE